MIHESLLFSFNAFKILGFSHLNCWASGRVGCLVMRVIEKELIETIEKLKNNQIEGKLLAAIGHVRLSVLATQPREAPGSDNQC